MRSKETPERHAYRSAKDRCVNRSNSKWEDYGGRGIEFRFKSFKEFFAELGPRPKGLVLDRKDNDGHYETDNVRWATWSESNRNRRPDVGSKIKEARSAVHHRLMTKQGHATPEARENHAEAARQTWNDPIIRQKRCLALQEAWKRRRVV